MTGRHARPTRAQARAGAFARERHEVSERVRRVRRRRATRRAKQASIGTATITGALLLGLLSGGGTLALWQGDAPHDAGVIVPAVEGEVALQFAVGSPTASTVGFTNLLPGESKTAVVLLQNTGEEDLDVDAELTSTTGSGYSLRLAIDAACTDSGFLSSPYLTGASLITATPVVIGGVDEGATVKLCVQVTAAAGITPSSAMTFAVTLIGDSGS